MAKQIRVIVYTLDNGKEEVFKMRDVEEEQHERAQAEREMHSRDTSVVGYHFEWRTILHVRDKTITVEAKQEYVGDADSRGPYLWKSWAKENPGIVGYGKEKEQAIAELQHIADSLYEFIPA
jgi:hypothetical protein